MTNKKSDKPKAPKLVQSGLGLFSEMDKDVFSSKHDEIMCWTDQHLLEIVARLWPNWKIQKIDSKRWEKPVSIIVKRQHRLIGFIDLAVEVTDSTSTEQHIYFEIKTTIRPGADIRQINAYQFYLEHPTDYEDGSEGWLCGPFVVVSPDDRHSELLAEQGIKFVKYPDFLDIIK